tara:strand:- start:2123 stop:2713 length:591 start_codon:yes stop_codon:yes gene_type:complete
LKTTLLNTVLILLGFCFANNQIPKDKVDSSFSEDSLNFAIKDLLQDVNKVPDFTLSSYDGNSYSIRDLEGKVILLNFWATWCAPCRMEIPELNEIQKKYSKEGFLVLGISITDTKKALEDFSDSYEVNYPLLYAEPDKIEKILLDYGGIYSVPTSILINKRGESIFNYPGAILKSYDFYDGVYSTLNKKISEALKE